jgi:hypothetical protein
MAKKRIKIPAELEKMTLYKSANTCNVCRDLNKGIQIHHIDQNPSNNILSNLIVLCQDCHDEAHTKHDLSKNLTDDKLSFFKKEWENEIADKASLAMLPSNNLQQAVWTFINHEKVGQIIKSRGIEFDRYLLSLLVANNVVDKYGIPIIPPKNSDSSHITIYNHYDYGNMHRLHKMYCEAVDSLIINVQPIEIGAIWSKREINAIVKPGSFIFSMRGYYFKTGKIANQEEDRYVYARSKDIEIRWYANTRHMFGTSALYDSFSGHRFAAAFLFVKSISKEDNLLILHCTPISMGAGFIQDTYKTPYKLKYGWNKN